MIQGCDYSVARPDVKKLKGAGKEFVCRYLTDGGLRGKALTREEAAVLRKVGLDLVLNFEESGDMSGGFRQGIADGLRALKAAKALDIPVRTIYFSVEAGHADVKTVIPYLNGAKKAIRPVHVGVYGPNWIVSAALRNSFEVWVADYDHSYWPPHGVSIWQYSGGQPFDGAPDAIDLDQALRADYGQAWFAPRWPGYDLKLGMDDPAVGVFFGEIHRRWGWRFGHYFFGTKFGWLKYLACKRFQASFDHFVSGEVDAKTWERAWM